MGDEHWQVLQCLRQLVRADASEVSEHIQWNGHVTAINNRLTTLLSLGLVERSKHRARWVYSLVK